MTTKSDNLQFVQTMRLKVKSDSNSWLNQAAREVNIVWNWCNETSEKAVRRYTGKAKWLTGFDLCKLSCGASSFFKNIGSDTIQRVNCEYAAKRRSAKKVRLNWRKSGGSRRSLGWVPFKAATIKIKGKTVRFAGKTIRVFENEKLVGTKWRDGSFAQDAMGDWWLCLPVRIEAEDTPAERWSVGIDLGLKTVATTSDGDKLEAGNFYRNIEQKIAQAQRRAHKKQAKRLQRKAARQRSDALHKFSRTIVNQYQNIFIGDVSSTKLAKTRMAKSVLDAGLGILKAQLQSKGQKAGRRVEIINETYTSRACSHCGCLSGPQGVNGLRVRQWYCVECGVTHDRDVNAARNILRRAEVSASAFDGNEKESIS